MKNFLSLATAIIISVVAANAFAFPREGKTYTNINAGYGINSPKVTASINATSPQSFKPMDRGFVFDAGFGYYLLDELRLSINPVYAQKLSGKKNITSPNAVSDKNIMNQYGIFANAYYDLLTGTNINPFIMGGFGFMRTELEDRMILGASSAKLKKSLSKAAYQAGVGLAYHMSSSVDAELGYRLVKQIGKKNIEASLPSSGITTSTKLPATQLVTVGFRFTF
ncbi:MAG: heat resistant agglutinin 1 [Candidatus Midichloriaceae bacterium]|jgi:opacity protein-like surface antigen|nr:heat resistant agglutinin 1 [Candidatus Midichloriaceae bacterium]